MIEVKEATNESILVMRVTGRLTKDDLERLVAPLQEHVEHSDNPRLLMIMENFKGWENVAAFWKDLKLDTTYIGYFEKIAVIGEEKWEQWLIDLTNSLTKSEMKFFETDEADNAWSWIRKDR